jgi:3-oxoacyl-[acyl-carrier-protein] synthase II
LNLDNPDPDCGIDLVPKEARDIRTDETLALARGLEGQGVAVVVRAVR